MTENTQCDVAIVGGGITGALIAHNLVEEGFDCIIIDKRATASGSTPASTALLLYELDTPLCQLAEQIGEEEAAACYTTCVEAIGAIGELVEKLGDDCDFKRRKSIYLAEHGRDVPELERECAMRLKHGIQVKMLDQAEVEQRFPFSRPAALSSPVAAEIDVVRFVDALLKREGPGNLRIHGGTELADYHAEPRSVVLHTAAGAQIMARRIVFATGYESEKYLGHKVGSLKSTFAIATTPIRDFAGWQARSLIWTTARPYLYLRTTADNRAIIGGEDIAFKNEKIRDALIPEKSARLEAAFRAMFPDIHFEVACRWAGTFGETPDSLARIGHAPGLPNVHFALGYGGNGITYSMIAAGIIRDACLGRKNPATRLFRLDR